MKTRTAAFLIAILLLQACYAGSTQIELPAAGTETPTPLPTETILPPSTPIPSLTPGKTISVTSYQDRGQGSLRQALQDAQPGDTITFDTMIFPPENPQTIALLSGLPPLDRGGITIDASNAGVILDGGQVGGEWQAALEIQSDQNLIMGLEIAGFSGPGILLEEFARNNVIGGERSEGSGPFGQGNLIRHTSDGIVLRGSDNTIQGNLIGTDITGTERWGNRGPGIFLEGNASHNVIGPGNVIAYNGEDEGGGVEIRSPSAQANHVTQNNIHDNASGAIFYNLGQSGSAPIPEPPLLLSVDMNQGVVDGIACPNCTVEFFTSGEAGEIFEGSVQADADGNFSFRKMSAFAGSLLKATSYAEDQNSSEFSIPVTSAIRILAFQEGNSLPRQRLPEVEFRDLDFNRTGIMFHVGCEDEQSAAEYLTHAERMGYTWMRVSVDWYDWPEVFQTGEYSDYTVHACQDKAIDLLAQNGIQLLYTLVYWDPEIEVTAGYTRFRNQDEIDRYLDYARFIVEHFKGRVQWYGILNESNLSDGQRAVRVNDYINLARQVIPVIKGIDPQAKVVIGEVTPLNEEGALEYLQAILDSDVLPLADGIAWHLNSGHSLDYQPDYYRDYPIWVDEIVTTAQRNSFEGQFFATEMHWRTAETAQPIDGMPWFYSDIVAGKYYARGMVQNLAQGFWITVGHEGYKSIPEVVQTITSLTQLLAGTQPEDMQVALGRSSPETRSLAFSLPDGSRLIAIWRDVIAVDDDPGEENTITLPNVQAQRVTGIDPLYAYQQELVFSQDGGVTIPGYLVRDYPTFLHLEGYSQTP